MINGSATIKNLKLYNIGDDIYIDASAKELSGKSNLFDVISPLPIGTIGMLTGKMVDLSGDPIPNATVYLAATLSGTTFEQPTGDNGDFVFSGLAFTTYSLFFKVPNGSLSSIYSISISPTNPNRINLKFGLCDKTKIPILLVAGAMGSSGTEQGASPQLPEGKPTDAFWKTDSFGLHDPLRKVGWSNLIDALRPYGYTMGCNLFAVPYDWRIPIEESTVEYLKAKIDCVKAMGYPKVHIIAHSMGGLLTRYYIQNLMKTRDIERFAMVGC